MGRQNQLFTQKSRWIYWMVQHDVHVNG